MEFPHAKREPEEFGLSPGNGITPMPLSVEPLATEAEVQRSTPPARAKRDPSREPNPYVFDDIADDRIPAPEVPEATIEPDLDMFDW